MTVMLVTMLYWWLHDGDKLKMSMIKSWLSMLKSVTNISNRSLTSTMSQHTIVTNIWSQTSVTNINMTSERDRLRILDRIWFSSLQFRQDIIDCAKDLVTITFYLSKVFQVISLNKMKTNLNFSDTCESVNHRLFWSMSGFTHFRSKITGCLHYWSSIEILKWRSQSLQANG